MKKTLSFVVIFLLFCAPVFAYVSPGAPSGYVNDFAQLFSAEEKTSLESTLVQFHASTSGEIAVAVVNDLGGDPIEEYANRLFREWGIGDKERNDGALLLVAMKERELRIEVGYGYEGLLTDARSSTIIRNTITPLFKEGKYGDGVTRGVEDMVMVLSGGVLSQDPIQTKTETSDSIDLSWIIPLCYLLFTWYVSILARSNEWWLGGVVGGIFGLIISVFVGFFYKGLVTIIILTLLGLLFDYVVSKGYKKSVASGGTPPWWAGGVSGGRRISGGGHFGGFGGGSSGGGGASGRW